MSSNHQSAFCCLSPAEVGGRQAWVTSLKDSATSFSRVCFPCLTLGAAWAVWICHDITGVGFPGPAVLPRSCPHWLNGARIRPWLGRDGRPSNRTRLCVLPSGVPEGGGADNPVWKGQSAVPHLCGTESGKGQTTFSEPGKNRRR